MKLFAVGTLKDAIVKLNELSIVVTETKQNRTHVGEFIYNGSIELFSENKTVGIFMPHGGWLKLIEE